MNNVLHLMSDNIHKISIGYVRINYTNSNGDSSNEQN